MDEKTNLPRTVWVLVHLIFVLLAAWLYFADGIAVVGAWVEISLEPGNFGRRVLLMIFSVVLWARMTYTAFALLKRRFDWDECVAVIGAVAFYQLGFAFLGATTVSTLSVADLGAVAVFCLGCFLNTGSEIQRKRFKENPANTGKLYTQGLFGVVRHPNYPGDILWATGWAWLTLNVWAMVIPVAAAAAFAFMFIPKLSAYLAGRYGDQYPAWARRTKRLIPYIY